MEHDGIGNWSDLKRGPIEITVEVSECPRCCRRVASQGIEAACVCVDEALGDLPDADAE